MIYYIYNKSIKLAFFKPYKIHSRLKKNQSTFYLYFGHFSLDREFNVYFADPITAFSLEVAEHNSRLKEQTGLELIEISSDDNYKIESEVELF